MGKALDAEERLHVCFTINASIISVKHFACDLFHFRYLFKMRYNSLKCVIIFVFRKQVLCHYFNELSFFVVYKGEFIQNCYNKGRVNDVQQETTKTNKARFVDLNDFAFEAFQQLRLLTYLKYEHVFICDETAKEFTTQKSLSEKFVASLKANGIRYALPIILVIHMRLYA